MNRKFNCLWFSFLIIFLMIRPTAAQETKGEHLFKLPADYCLALNVIQNSSPVQFKSIDVLVERNGLVPFLNWRLRNNSPKTVKRFVIALKIRTNIDQWRGFTGQIEYDSGVNEKNDLILPYATYQETDYEMNSLLPQEIHNLFSVKKVSDDAKFIIVYGMIKKIVFNDGSIYAENNQIFEH